MESLSAKCGCGHQSSTFTSFIWKCVQAPLEGTFQAAPTPETTTHPSLRSSCKLQQKAPWRGIGTSLSPLIHDMIRCNFLTSLSREDSKQNQQVFLTCLLWHPAGGLMDIERTLSLPWCICPHLPYIQACALLWPIFLEKGARRCADLLREFSRTRIFHSGPLQDVMSGTFQY